MRTRLSILILALASLSVACSPATNTQGGRTLIPEVQTEAECDQLNEETADTNRPDDNPKYLWIENNADYYGCYVNGSVHALSIDLPNPPTPRTPSPAPAPRTPDYPPMPPIDDVIPA